MTATASYPSWESHTKLGKTIFSSVDYCRLRWYLKGTLSESIRVLRDASDPNSPQDPYQTGTDTHAICTSSLTEPPISSVLISIRQLDYYASDWNDVHERHHDPEDTKNLIMDHVGILRCSCGHVRPLPGPSLLVQAEPGQFLTIGKYVDVVHPWLIKLEGHIRVAHDVWSDWPLDQKYEIWVGSVLVSELSMRNGHGSNQQWEEMEWKMRAEYAQRALRSRPEATK